MATHVDRRVWCDGGVGFGVQNQAAERRQIADIVVFEIGEHLVQMARMQLVGLVLLLYALGRIFSVNNQCAPGIRQHDVALHAR